MNYGRQSVGSRCWDTTPVVLGFLTSCRTGSGTMSGREFDWGGRLERVSEALKVPQNGRKPFEAVQRQRGA